MQSYQCIQIIEDAIKMSVTYLLQAVCFASTVHDNNLLSYLKRAYILYLYRSCHIVIVFFNKSSILKLFYTVLLFEYDITFTK